MRFKNIKLNYETNKHCSVIYNNDNKPCYIVWPDGDIYSCYLKRNIKKRYHFKYLRVTIFIDGRRIDIFHHVLLAMLFIPNKENKMVVNHINGIKDDNKLENLAWVTHSENTLHYYQYLKKGN